MLGLGVAAMQCSALMEARPSPTRANPQSAGARRLHGVLVATAVALLVAVALNRVGSRTLLAATGLPQVWLWRMPMGCLVSPLLREDWRRNCRRGHARYISNYVSINDVGNVAFVASVPVLNSITGAREHRGNVYVGGEESLGKRHGRNEQQPCSSQSLHL